MIVLKTAGFVVLTVGGAYFSFVWLLAAPVLFWAATGVNGLHPSIIVGPVAEMCFTLTALAFGVGGLSRTVIRWLRDRKAQTQTPAQTH